MSLIAKAPKVSEDHWYDRNGLPMYTVTSQDGEIRATTLRDARKMDLVPSVTTIMKLISKPALTQWMQKQVLLSALTLPKKHDESESQYIDRILEDSKAQGRAAADKGVAIHNAIEAFYSGLCVDHHAEHVMSTTNAIAVHFGEHGWVAERSFAHDLGFGGKVDLFAPGFVLDIKTQDFDQSKSATIYDEHVIQLAAYRVGLGMPNARCANVYVSRTHPNEVFIHEWLPDSIDRGWQMFCSLLNFWQLKNFYK